MVKFFSFIIASPAAVHPDGTLKNSDICDGFTSEVLQMWSVEKMPGSMQHDELKQF